jgi:DNA-binding transcriptional ArsR family regulator
MLGMALPSPLPDALVDLIAHRFRVLGEPTRVRLLDSLRDGPASVSDLQAATGASQQNVSKHLGMLLEAGMVRRTKDGNRAYYSIADDSLLDLCEQVCGSVRRQVAELDALLHMEGAPTR